MIIQPQVATRLQALVSANRALLYTPSPGQKEFHSCTSRFRLIRAGNQVGKSTAGIMECIWWLSGKHPYRPTPNRPIRMWAVISDWESSGAAIQRKFWELIPKHLLEPGWDWTENRGWLHRKIKLKTGSTLEFRSSNQRGPALESDTLDAIWIDEPPDRSQWGAILSRLVARGGSLWMTFTPIGRPVEWLREAVEGKDGDLPELPWEQFPIKLNKQNCPHRSQESIDEQIAMYGIWERAQRVEGAWEGLTYDRLFDAFTPMCEVTAVPSGNYNLAIGIDHGEKTGREAAVLIMYDRTAAYIIDEYISTSTTDPFEDSIAIRKMVARHGYDISMVDTIVGDINSAGKLGGGRRINDILADHLKHEVEIPLKIAGSVGYGCRLMNISFKRQKLYIHQRCAQTIYSMKHWKGEDDNLKHCVSGDTIVETDAGPRTIRDLDGITTTVLCYDIETKTYVHRQAVIFKTSDSQPMVRLHWDGGYLDCTPDHQILVNDTEWKPSAKILPSDVLMYNATYGAIRYGVHYESSDDRRTDTGVSGPDLLPPENRILPGILVGDKETSAVAYSSMGSQQWCETTGVPCTPSESRQVGQPDRESGDDSSVGAREDALHPRTEKTSIRDNACVRSTSGSGMAPDIRDRQTPKERNIETPVAVDQRTGTLREPMQPLQQGIRDIHPETQSVLPSELQNEGPTYPATITAIEWIDSGPVYNMHVEEHHNFVANGIVVHNCQDAARYALVPILEKLYSKSEISHLQMIG